MPFTAPETDEEIAIPSAPSGFSAPPDDEEVSPRELPDYTARVEAMAKEPSFNEFAHASEFPEGNPERQFAHDVYLARKKSKTPTGDEKSWWEVLKSVPKIAAETVTSIPSAAAVQLPAAVMGQAATGFRLLDYATGSGTGKPGAPKTWMPESLDKAYEHQKALAQIQEAKALENAKHTAGAILGEHPVRDIAKNAVIPGWGSLSRAQDIVSGWGQPLDFESFSKQADDFGVQRKLSEGTVPPESVMGEIADTIGIDVPVKEQMSPLERYAVDSGAIAVDPSNLALAAAPVPGAAQITKGAGRLAEGVSDAALNAIKTPLGKKIAAGGVIGGGGLLIADAVQNPGRAAKHIATGAGIAAALLATRYGGKILKEAGQMGLGEAVPETISPMGARVRQSILSGVSGAEMGAATAALEPNTDARKVLQGAVSMGALGGGLGLLHSVRPALTRNLNLHEEQAGRRLAMAEAQTSPYAQKSAELIAQYPPEVQSQIYRMKGRLQTRNPVELHLLDGDTFAKVTGGSGNERGAFRGNNEFAQSSDGRTIYLNADAPSNAGQGVTQPLRHESGHALVGTLKVADQESNVTEMTDAIQKALTPEEINEAGQKYAKALLGREATPQEGALVDVKGETLAEITRKILNGEDLGKFGLPKPLTEKLTDASGRYLQNAEWVPDWLRPSAIGDSEGMSFGAKNVTESARLIRDALYGQGKEARDLRIKGNADTKLNQANARLTEIESMKRGDVTPEILAEREQLIKQRDAAQAGLGAISEGPKPPTVQIAQSQKTDKPLAQVGQTPTDGIDRSAMISAMQSMGIPLGEARQWVQVAQGATTEEALSNALSQRMQAKNPPKTAPSSPPAPVSKPLATVIPQAAPEGVQAEPKKPLAGTGIDIAEPPTTPTAPPVENDRLPLGSVDVPTAPRPEIAKPLAEPAAPPVRKTPQERMAEARAEAEKSDGYKRARKKDEYLAKAETQALKQAVVEDAGENPALMQERVDEETGKKRFTGDLDPELPSHRAIMDRAGLTEGSDAAQVLSDLQANRGNTVYLKDYQSAAKEVGDEASGIDRSGAQRTEEYGKSTAGQRLRGDGEVTEQDKAFSPITTVMNADGSVRVFGFSHDRLLSNVGKLVDFLRSKKMDTGYDGVNDPLLPEDMQSYAMNHANNVVGDGSKPIAGQEPTPGYSPRAIPKTRFDVLNAAMQGQSPTAKSGSVKGQEARTLAMENEVPVDPQTLDTNPLRAFIDKSGELVDTKGGKERKGTGEILEPVFESIRPELVKGGVSTERPEMKADTVRPTDFQGSHAEITKEGLPNSKFTQGGFMPDEEIPSYWDLFRFGSSKFTIDGTPFSAELVKFNDIENIPATEFLIENIRTGYNESGNKFGVTGTMGPSGARKFLREAERHALSVAKALPEIWPDAVFARSSDETRTRLYDRIFHQIEGRLPGSVATKSEKGESVFAYVKPSLRANEQIKTLSSMGFDVRPKSKPTQEMTGFMPSEKESTAQNGQSKKPLAMSRPPQEFMPGDDAEFVQPERAKRAGDVVVNVKIADFDKAFAKDNGFYVAPGGEGGIKGRREGFEDFMKRGSFDPRTQSYTKKPIEMPEVTITPQGVAAFVNGRHRYSVLRDAGRESMPVSMDAEGAARAKELGLVADDATAEQKGDLSDFSPDAAEHSRGGFMPSEKESTAQNGQSSKKPLASVIVNTDNKDDEKQTKRTQGSTRRNVLGR